MHVTRLKDVELILIRQEPGRPLAAPPGVPADRLDVLRRAFDETIKDPEFLAEAEKGQMEIEPSRISPGGAAECSQGRQPLEREPATHLHSAPEGRHSYAYAAPPGLKTGGIRCLSRG